MGTKLFRSPAVFFQRQIQDLLEVSGGDFGLQLPAGSPLQPAVTLLHLLLKTNPKHKLEINLTRSDKYWVQFAVNPSGASKNTQKCEIHGIRIARRCDKEWVLMEAFSR